KATGNDFIVPPAPYAFADIAQTSRINPGSSGTVTISTAGKIALVLLKDWRTCHRFWWTNRHAPER
ncbi:MAG TPA: hypothetical protein VGR85_07510, partial [Candidatus Limnocylindria bacterium]|nr:hypothetical protein [Candidatus Limnocylindria bacterium]